MTMLGLPALAGLAVGWAAGRRGRVVVAEAPSTGSSWMAQLAARWQAVPKDVLLVMAAVLAGIWVFITLGFALSGRAAPGVLSFGFVPALLVLLYGLARGVQRLR
jgi:hypothetical protein